MGSPGTPGKPRGANSRGGQEGKKIPPPPPKPPPPPQARKRPEAVLVRVPPTASYLDTYKLLLSKGRETLMGVKGVKKSHQGHILLEIEKGTNAETLAQNIRGKIGAGLVCTPLQNRVSLELRDLDPMVEGPEILQDLGGALKVPPEGLKLRTLRLGPRGTQTAVVEAALNDLSNLREGGVRFRSGLTWARARVLPRITRCFRCHMVGHMARECPTVDEGKELCRRCGATDHLIARCSNPPKCGICSKEGLTGPRIAHVTASLACPFNRPSSGISKPRTEPRGYGGNGPGDGP